MGSDLIIDNETQLPVDDARVLMPGGDRFEVKIPEGVCVARIIASCIPLEMQHMVVAWNHGNIINDTESFIPRAGDKLLLTVVPQGGKNKKGIIGAILTIVVAVVAWYVAPAFLGAAYGTAGYAGLTGTQLLMAQGIAAGLTMIGTMAISALIKPPGIGVAGGLSGVGVGSTQAYTLTGQSNAARPYAACFVVYGMHKIMPALAATPNIDNIGTHSQIMAIYDFGLGYVNLYDIKIGDVPVYNFSPKLYVHYNSLCRDLQYNFNQIGYDQYSIQMNQYQKITVVTKPETIYADLDINFPRGIYQASSTQGAIPFTIQLYAEYRPMGTPGDGGWQQVPIDYYFGESNKWYLQAPQPTITVSMMWDENRDEAGNVIGYFQTRGPVNYNPAATPGIVQSWIADYRAYLVNKYAYLNYWGYNIDINQFLRAENLPLFWTQVGFDEGQYYARYPDVANWHNQNPGVNTAWMHFSVYGYNEGRDPYNHPWYENHVVVMQATSTSPYWMRIMVPFPYAGTWEIRVLRFDPSHDGSDFAIGVSTNGAITAQVNEAFVALLRSYKPALPINVSKNHTMLEMQVVATDQLNGVVQNLSAVAVSVLPVTNDGINFWYAETRNPAWIVLDILTSEKNPKPLSRAQIDWPAWLHLAAVCDAPRFWNINGQVFNEPRFMCDIVVDSFTSVRDLVESILSGCHASLAINTAGLWTVLVDEEKATPRQLLTPANSWGFSGARTFSNYPHGLRVSFLNRNMNWAQDEVVVYDDGYNASNATVFESLDTYGITDYQHAWAYGRYMLAQGIQRSELFTVSMDIENLVVQRGDRVEVAFDVPKIGGYPTRVVSVIGNQVLVTFDASIVPTGYSVRLQNGTIRTGRVIAAESGEQYEYERFTLDNAAGVQPDDLIVLGDFERTVAPYLVQSIQAGTDLVAELTLCKYVPGVYGADQGMIPPWDPSFSRDFMNGTDLRSINVTASWRMFYRNRMPLVEVTLNWITTGWNLEYHNIFVIFPTGSVEAVKTNVKELSATIVYDPINAPQYFDVDLQIKVLPVSGLGFEGVPGYTTLRMTGDHTPPQVPIDFGVNVQKEQIGIFWRHSDDPDIGKYLLRFTPETIIPNWDQSQLLAQMPYPANSFSVGARTGTYMIRVVDTSGNQSEVLYRRTTVARLPDINVITQVDDADDDPPWAGYHSNTQTTGPVVELSGPFGYVSPEGYYVFRELIDLGDVFEVRISSMLIAYGVSPQDYMSTWETLAMVPRLSTVASDYWDAWLEVRTADVQSVMSDWVLLSDVDPLTEPNEGDWSAWRGVRVGDFTGRLFEFRINMKSYNPYVRTVVSSGWVILDMPDRIDSDYDIVIPAGTVDIDFEPAFRNVPAIAITIDGNADPVVAEITQKTQSGFTLGLRNVNTDALVPGKIDWMAKGYGRQRPAPI